MKPRRTGISTGPPVAVLIGVSLNGVRASTSHLPRLEIDARIDPSIAQIGDQVHGETDQREDVKIGEYHRIVAVEHALEAQVAEAIEREDGLDQQRATE